MVEIMENRERLPHKNDIKIMKVGRVYDAGQWGMDRTQGKFKEYEIDISGKRENIAVTEKGDIFTLREGKFVRYGDSSAERIKKIAVSPLASKLPAGIDRGTTMRKTAKKRIKEEEKAFCEAIGIPFDSRNNHYDEVVRYAHLLCFRIRPLKRKWTDSQREGPYRHDPYEARDALHQAQVLPTFLFQRHQGLKDPDFITVRSQDAAHYQRFDGTVEYRHPQEAGIFHPATAEILDFYNEPSLERVLQKILTVEIPDRHRVLDKVFRGQVLEPDEQRKHPDLVRGISPRKITIEQESLREVERRIRAVLYYLTASKTGKTKTVDILGFLSHVFPISGAPGQKRRYDERVCDLLNDSYFEDTIESFGNIFDVSHPLGDSLMAQEKDKLEVYFSSPQVLLHREMVLNIDRTAVCCVLQDTLRSESGSLFQASTQLYQKGDYKKTMDAHLSALQRLGRILDLEKEKEDIEMRQLECVEVCAALNPFATSFEIQRMFLQSACTVPRAVLERNPALLTKVVNYYETEAVRHSLTKPEQLLLSAIVNPKEKQKPLAIVNDSFRLYKEHALSVKGITPEVLFRMVPEPVMVAYRKVQACVLQKIAVDITAMSTASTAMENRSIPILISSEKCTMNIRAEKKGPIVQWICTVRYPDQTEQTFTLDALEQSVHTRRIAQDSLRDMPAVKRLLNVGAFITSGLMNAEQVLKHAVENDRKTAEAARAAKVILSSVCQLYEQSGLREDLGTLKDVKKFLQEHKDVASQVIGSEMGTSITNGINELELWEQKSVFTRLSEMIPGISEDTWGKTLDETVIPFVLSIFGGVSGGQALTRLTSGWASALAKRGATRTSWLLSQASSAMGLGVGMYSTGEAYKFAQYYGLGQTQFTPDMVQYARGYITGPEYCLHVGASVGLSAGSSFFLSIIGGPMGAYMRGYLARHGTKSKDVLSWVYRSLLGTSSACNYFEHGLRSMIPQGRSRFARAFAKYWEELCEESAQDVAQNVTTQMWSMWASKKAIDGDWLSASGGYAIGLLWMFQGKYPGSAAGIAPMGDLRTYHTVWRDSFGVKQVINPRTQRPDNPHCWVRKELASVHYSSTYAAGQEDALYKEIEELLLQREVVARPEVIKDAHGQKIIRVTYKYREVTYTHEWQSSTVPAFVQRVYYVSCDEDHRSPLDAFRFAINEDTGTCSVDRLTDENGDSLQSYFRYQRIEMLPHYDQNEEITHYTLRDMETGEEAVLHILGNDAG